MDKIKIKLSTPELLSDFINICSKYNCDINIYDGRMEFDAKSIVAVFSIPLGKVIYVQAISNNEDIICNFIHDIKKFTC